MTRQFGPFQVTENALGLTITASPAHLERIRPEVEALLQPSVGLRPTLEYVRARGAATSREVADALGLQIANASNKLAALQRDGYLVRQERSAPSGGVEFEYRCAGYSAPNTGGRDGRV
jgi:hypothetical protein